MHYDDKDVRGLQSVCAELIVARLERSMTGMI